MRRRQAFSDPYCAYHLDIAYAAPPATWSKERRLRFFLSRAATRAAAAASGDGAMASAPGPSVAAAAVAAQPQPSAGTTAAGDASPGAERAA